MSSLKKGFHETEFLDAFSESPENCRDFLDDRLQNAFSDVYEDRHSEIVRRVLDLVPDTPLSAI